ncbi:MAG: PAS domain-containing protein [Spirochaetales bacterium]|nr:PAS domain-containing protein [Spirochaetales bacterium]
MGFTHDKITIKQDNKWLENSEILYHNLLSAYPDGIVIMDLEGHIIDISAITVDILKENNKKEIIGTNFLQYVHKSEIERIKQLFATVNTEGIVKNVEIVLVRDDYLPFICDMSVTLIQEPDGRLKAYLVVFKDITRQKRIENQLMYKSRMVSLGQMASAMAHEINQPLISISLSVENLMQTIHGSVPQVQQYVDGKIGKIQEDVYRIGNIIDHIRAFSQNYDDLLNISFNVNKSIQSVLSMMSQQMINKGIKLIQTYDQNVLPVHGNPYRFEQVIVNLLVNSINAIEEKNQKIKKKFEKTITIQTYHNIINNYVEILDNGIGIEEQDINEIILPFYTTRNSEKGSGLGLPIAFMILREMNGGLTIESESLIGTTILITIPGSEA